MCGDGVHQHAGRISRLAARHIDADTVERRDLLAQQRAVLVAVTPALAVGLLLRLVVAAHALGGGRERAFLRIVQAVESGLQLGLRELQLGHALDVERVESRGVFQHRRVAALLHIGEDVRHALLDGRVRIGRPMQSRREVSLERGRGGGQANRYGLQ
ncbi:hypothetical protein SDC9_157193 [bioreactor metagenome]|uniref:Uncharacterized protein n=1 Tax=bioreactor metagenome TaxID=1076179 RepID=A0A645F7N7_9ZZZZ